MKMWMQFIAAAVVGSAVLTGAQAQTQQANRDPESTPSRASIKWPPGYIEPNTPNMPYLTPDTPTGTGPFKAIMTTDPGAKEFVIYHPANLAALGTRKMPIVVWGNGSCTYIGNRFRHFLTEIASHGYLAVAGGVMGPKERETITMASNNPTPAVMAQLGPNPPAAAPANPNQVTVTHDLLSKGIDWAIAENSRQGSKFFGKLDTSSVAVMGQSCGSRLAGSFAGDPRVKTVGMWMGANADMQTKHTAPVLIITGSEIYDVGYPRGKADFAAINNVPIFYAWRDNLPHLGTFRQQNGGEQGKIAVAWLQYQFRGDPQAAQMFKGPNCTLCKDPAWHVGKKRID